MLQNSRGGWSNRLQSQIALTLCHLKRIFPPSFFDIMEHLPIHLAEEAKIAGPVQYRWMYFIERCAILLQFKVVVICLFIIESHVCICLFIGIL